MNRLVAIDLPGGPLSSTNCASLGHGRRGVPVDQRLPDDAKRDVCAAMRVGDEVEPGDALVVATSGSTGTPKGVVLTHDAVAASARATSDRLGVADDDHWLACLPLSHVGGLSVVTRALHTGTRLTVLPGFDAAAVEAVGRDAGVPRGDRARAHRPGALPPHRARREPAARRPSRQLRDDLRDDRDRERRGLRRGAARRRRGRHRRRWRDPAPGADAAAVLPRRHDPVDADGWFATGDLGEWRPTAGCTSTVGAAT